MLKKSVALIALSVFAANSLVACGSSPTTFVQPQLQQVQPNQQVGTLSLTGINSEIKKANAATFKALDKNTDKHVTPDEYVVDSPDQMKAFNAIDGNGDGKITEKEWMPNFFSRAALVLRLRKTARTMFKTLDKSKDGYLSKEELNSPILSASFVEKFEKYDKEKKGWLFNRGTQGKLSKSEFENMFANVAMGGVPGGAPTEPAPAPADPAQPAPAFR